MTLRETMRGALGRREPGVDVDVLLSRVGALRHFLEAAGGAVPAGRLSAAERLVSIAGERLSLSRNHTLVALAGATGSGKSSLFNALTDQDWSAVGFRRPTTGFTHACVWGPGGSELLDWLDVPAPGRFRLDDDGGDLHGLVLLDLPDVDSVAEAHRAEVDRLLPLVDLVVWVLDPQKYADALVHQRYLRTFRHLRPVTVVVLNQADLLGPGDARRCLADLSRLLAADGLAGVPTMAVSSYGEPGTDELRTVLGGSVAARQAALRRLATELDVVVADLRPLVDRQAAGQRRTGETELIQALAGMAGVAAVVEAAERAYKHRAGQATGWPVTRWLGRLRPDPLRRLHLGGGQPEAPVEATSVPPATGAQRAAALLAIRAMAERAGADLPEPWTTAVASAARARLDRLPDALDAAIAGTAMGMDRRPRWWRSVGAVQWLLVAVALLGLAWLSVRVALLALGLPAFGPVRVGMLPLPTLLLLGGVVAGVLVSAVTRPLIGLGSRRAGVRARRRLQAAVADVATEYVLAPVDEVRRRYMTARGALAAART